MQIVHAGKTDAVLPEQPWPERTHHVTSENGWATTTTILQLAAGEATLAAMKAAFPHVVLCFLPPQSTSYLQPCDVAVFRSFKSCTQTQASATLARAVLDGSFDGLAMNKAWRRQSSAEWAARAIADILAEGKVWSTGWRQLRAHNDGAFRDDSRDDLFARHIAPDPAEEGPPMWAMAEETDDEGEDDAPMPDAPPEPELIDMPPAPASALRISHLERCIALRLVYGSGPQ